MPVLNPSLRLQDAIHFKKLDEGMVAREIVTLQQGEKIYRFASSATVPAIKRAAAPWWWQETEFRRMLPSLQMDPTNVGMIARRLGAIKFGWGSQVDVLLEARIEQAIRVFVGPGKYQVDPAEQVTGARVNWVPPDLDQIYIPNISNRPAGELSKTVWMLGEIRSH